MNMDQINAAGMSAFLAAVPKGKSKNYHVDQVSGFIRQADAGEVFSKDQLQTSKELEGVLTLPLGTRIRVILLNFFCMKQQAASVVASWANKYFSEAHSAHIEKFDPSFYDPNKRIAGDQVPGAKRLQIGSRWYNAETPALAKVMVASALIRGTMKPGDRVLYDGQALTA